MGQSLIRYMIEGANNYKILQTLACASAAASAAVVHAPRVPGDSGRPRYCYYLFCVISLRSEGRDAPNCA